MGTITRSSHNVFTFLFVLWTGVNAMFTTCRVPTARRITVVIWCMGTITRSSHNVFTFLFLLWTGFHANLTTCRGPIARRITVVIWCMGTITRSSHIVVAFSTSAWTSHRYDQIVTLRLGSSAAHFITLEVKRYF